MVRKVAAAVVAVAMVVASVSLVVEVAADGGGDLAQLRDPRLRQAVRQANISCLLVFGDSSVDPGNNNLLNTTMKSNFLPYGIDFHGHTPTGRFSNGRLTTDFIAEALGIEDAIPGFLQTSLPNQQLLHGASFASAASGYDDLTANFSGVLPMWKQIDYFRHYLVQLKKMVGTEEEEELIVKNAIVVLSAGTNDFIQNYFLLPVRQKQFTIDQYIDFLVASMEKDLKDISELGGRRYAVVGVPPLGCMPLVKAFRGQNGCVTELNRVVVAFNDKVKAKLATINQWLGKNVRAAYVDAYSVILDAIQNPNKYGFSVSSKGCCGSGVLEFGETCKGLNTCRDPTKYVFWDAVHPTESMYRIMAIEAIKEVSKSLI